MTEPSRRERVLAAREDERQRRSEIWSQPMPTSGPWHAGSIIVSGVLFYGGAGWLLGAWLGAPWLTAVGVLAGTAVAMLSLWFRYGVQRPEEPTGPTATSDGSSTDTASPRSAERPDHRNLMEDAS